MDLSDISLFYQSLENLFYPLLIFGLFYILFYISYNEKTEDGDNRYKATLKKLTRFYWWLWFIMAVLVGIFFLVKAVSTSIGWVVLKSGESMLWGLEVPGISDGLGLACLIAVSLFTISLVIFFINGMCIACGLENSNE